MRDFIYQHKTLLTALLIIVISAAFGSSYFIRPSEKVTEIVTVDQEWPDANNSYPIDSGLAARISKSYGYALVLTISEYSQRNAVALNGIGEWARDQFQKDPAFLHRDLAEPTPVGHVSVVESLFYSLFSGPRNFLRELSLDFVKQQVTDFHSTVAYEHFRRDYFESFGMDREAALLLAKYQSDKARTAVNVVLSFIFWSSAFLVCAFFTWRTKYGERTTRTQRLLAYFWMVLGAYYLNVAWSQNQVVLLVSAVVCGFAGLFLKYPFNVEHSDGRFAFRQWELSRQVIACCAWISFTLVAVQVMIWFKSGSLGDPDPLTLFLSSLTGNFVHDPASAKRAIKNVIGILWIIATLWVLREITFGSPSEEIEKELASLNPGRSVTDELDKLNIK